MKVVVPATEFGFRAKFATTVSAIYAHNIMHARTAYRIADYNVLVPCME